jgi:hypothetical protein
VAQATRTANPLPFQDLEPRRFEDLIRQLGYDFKPWRKLEATGRSGSDGSFDARGYEIVPTEEPTILDTGDDDESPVESGTDRLWLIQCKRERSITPKKLRKYLDDIPAETRSQLYGVIFAAACDFSKSTRDTFAEWARTHGISETHMWGKGELEDQLYQPKNDNLLFAYFGISLQIRRRAIRTALRSRLAMKKRAETILGERTWASVPILLRDPTDDRYPYTDDASRNYRGRWRVVTFSGQSTYGLKYLIKKFFAYVDDERKGWDMVEAVNDASPAGDDHWHSATNEHEQRHRIVNFWWKLPDHNRAWYIEEQCIRYEDILAIDETGDEHAHFPHVYVEPSTLEKRFIKIEFVNSAFRPSFRPDPANRIKYFPDTFPDPPPAEPDPPRPGEDERLGRRSQ